MHQYLKAIGFGDLPDKRIINSILQWMEISFSEHKLIKVTQDMDFGMYRKELGENIGLLAYGDVDETERFERVYYMPYLLGRGVTSYADVFIQRRIDREAYLGVCEDSKVGISLIFSLQNTLEYMKERQLSESSVKFRSVTLSGLANEGTILLPISKNEEQTKRQMEESRNRMMLQSAAKTGDQLALESLTLEDFDTYSKVAKRLVNEDLFTIVETSLMPYGIECDRYSILGEIIDLQIIENELSNRKIYLMRLDVNELQFDVCVPVDSVMGEPEVGRRFKGNIWLQGRVNF